MTQITTNLIIIITNISAQVIQTHPRAAHHPVEVAIVRVTRQQAAHQAVPLVPQDNHSIFTSNFF